MFLNLYKLCNLTDSLNDGNQDEGKKRQWSSWYKKQKSVLLKHFQNNINKKITPRKLERQEKYKDPLTWKTCIQTKIFVYTFNKM